jgi:collagen type I/II/III/V/XI/XXIV/XXVII alpha
MTTRTFTTTAGGSWETASNWTGVTVPGENDDAVIGVPGTYTVTLSGAEEPNSVTISDPNATLSIAASGQLAANLVTLNSGTLALAGSILGSTIVENGGILVPNGGTLDGVTLQGPLGGLGSGFQTVSIEDGITLLNQAGTGPGTLTISTLYEVYVLDSTPLSDMIINFNSYNNEYLNGPAGGELIVDISTTINQSQASASAEITGGTLLNNGTISATGNDATVLILSNVFDNTGTVTAAGGDHVSIYNAFTNTGTMQVTGASKLTISDANPNVLSNPETIAVSGGSSLVVSGSLGGGGVITLSNLAIADMFNTNNTVTFLDSKDTLRLEAPGTFTGKIAGLVKGDKIDLLATPVTKVNYAGTTASGTLTVMNNTTTVAAINLLGDYLQSTFSFGSDGSTGNNISVVVSTIAPRTLDWTGSDGTTAFNAPSNWNDVSDALNPALTAPTLVDTVVFNTSGGYISGSPTVAAVLVGTSGVGALELTGGTTLIAGSLDAGVLASDVGQIGLTGSGTEFNVKGSATVADDGTGVMSVLNGATFSAAELTIGNTGDSSGALVVSGDNTIVNISGNLNVGTSLGTGDLTIGPGATVNALVVSLQGQVVLENGELDPTVNLINQGQTAGGSGAIAAGDIVDEGVIQAGGSKPSQKLLTVSGTVVGGGPWTINGVAQFQANGDVGVLQINAGGTLELTGPVSNAATTTFTDDVTPQHTYTVNDSVIDVNFEDATGVLKLDDISGFAGTITSFRKGDDFVITGGTLSNLGVSNNNTLTVSDPGNGGTDQIMFASAISSSGFTIVNNNTIQVACFAAGTRIETATGYVPVEQLSAGDRVVTMDGRDEPIVWLGQRTVNCAAHPDPKRVWPVRISAGAFQLNVPCRDLFLSPDHAVLVDDALIPAKYLINGTSIVQVPERKVTYYHIELAEHDILLADGLPTESYLDTGDRSNFSNGGVPPRLHPDFSVRMWEARGVKPLIVTGPLLEAARKSINSRAPTAPKTDIYRGRQ